MMLKWFKDLNNNIFTLENKKKQNKTKLKTVLSSHIALPSGKDCEKPNVFSNSENA